METRQAADIECKGGIRLYAVPIVSDGEVVGAMNFGYGDPPKDPGKLQEISQRYALSPELLYQYVDQYESRPPFVVAIAKKRLQTAARLVGEIIKRKQMEEEIRRSNVDLERRVAERTANLDATVRELEAFGHSIAHDMRTPLRAVKGFSQMLLEDYAERLDATGRHCLNRLQASSQRMEEMIDALSQLSQVILRQELRATTVHLSGLAREIAEELRGTAPERQVAFVIAPSLQASGDATLLRAALANLLGNAWKFTGQQSAARIEFGATERAGERVYFVRDNGVGFDITHAGKLFVPFQRLHGPEQFAGTGMGLAIVDRAIRRHGGRVWGEASLDRGATFSFTLGNS